MSKQLSCMQHGHWITTIDLVDGVRPYRVTTASGIRNHELQTFENTLEKAKQTAVDHMYEVSRHDQT